jgi:hypothetical protein
MWELLRRGFYRENLIEFFLDVTADRSIMLAASHTELRAPSCAGLFCVLDHGPAHAALSIFSTVLSNSICHRFTAACHSRCNL